MGGDRMKKIVFFNLILVCFVAGCASRYVVKEATNKKFISTVSTSCAKPYSLEQDCSKWWGAKRMIDINGNKLKIAGTADGKIILVMDKSPIASAFKAGLAYPFHDSYSKGNSDNFQVIKYELQNQGVEIVDVRPMGSFGSLDGYFLVLNKDGYSALKMFSVEK